MISVVDSPYYRHQWSQTQTKRTGLLFPSSSSVTDSQFEVPPLCRGEILGLGVLGEGARFRLGVSGVGRMID